MNRKILQNAEHRTQNTQPLKIDGRARQVWKGEQEIHLTQLEFEVLAYLKKHVGRVVTYEELWREVWKHSSPLNESEQAVVRQAIKRLRNKLDDTCDAPRFLICVRNVGFRLENGSLKVED